jgi:shikimate kinase
MGSGKSTIGPILANTIGYDFVDLDRLIEEREGRSVTRIFHEQGEAHFRSLERMTLGDIIVRTNIVVSLGGGTLVDGGSQQVVLENGILVYLKLTPDQMMRRLQNKTDRPMLLGPDGAQLNPQELRGRVESLFAHRAPLYEMADLTVPTDERRLGVTVDHLVHKLSPYL